MDRKTTPSPVRHRTGRLAAAMLAACLATFALPATASYFYKFRIIAETPTGGFTAFGKGPSINGKGNVAFIGVTGTDQAPYFGNGSALPVAVTPGGGSTLGDGVQINEKDLILTQERHAAASSILTEIRIHDPATGLNTAIVRGNDTVAAFDAVFPFPTLNNKDTLEDMTAAGNGDGACDTGETCLPQVAFGGFHASPLSRTIATPIRIPTAPLDPGSYTEFALNSTTPHPSLSDTGRIVVRGRNATDPLFLFEPGLGTPKQIANFTDNLFSTIGNAASITPDGKVIAFAGDRGNGSGVFIAVERSAGKWIIYNLAGENDFTPRPELGFDATGQAIYFSSIDVDSRVGIVLTPDAAGTPNASVVVSFVGTPSDASRANPATGKPLTFTAGKGIFTIRVDLDPVGMDGTCVSAGPDGTLDTSPDATDVLVTSPYGHKYDTIATGADKTCETEPFAGDEALFSRTSPIPVVQVGDKIHSVLGTHTVTDVGVNFPIARATHAIDTGAARTERVGDHRVAFWVSTDLGQLIMSGDHLDSDQDGLLDHWETEGIDIDQDGNVDLDLAAMGANPNVRDIFLHIDLTADRTDALNVHRVHEVMPGVIDQLVSFYAAMPALPNGIAAGVKLHVDMGALKDRAGMNFTHNMGAGPLKGGFTLTGAGGTPIDVTYFGAANSVNVPGVVAVSFETLKQANFSMVHKGARELAFLFVTLGDFHHMGSGFDSNGIIDNNTAPFIGSVTDAGVDSIDASAMPFFPSGAPVGHALKITQGKGAGQLRTIRDYINGNSRLYVHEPWAVVPDATSKFVFFDGSAGEGHAGDRWDGAFSPGRDLAITLGGYNAIGSTKFQGKFREEWQTLAHEIGHLITLKHGGINHDNNYDPKFHSLMNYLYENCESGKPPSAASNPNVATCPVDTYSTASDLVFNDQFHMDTAFGHHLDRIGNALGVHSDVPGRQQIEPPMTVKRIEELNGPQDVTAPTLGVTAPAAGASFGAGSSITVTGTVTDDHAVTSVKVTFDLNGDGVVDPAEVFNASLGGSTFNVTLPPIAGPDGARTLAVIATDTSLNPEIAQIAINVGASTSVTVPNVVGLTQAAATTAITGAGLTLGAVTQQASSTVAAGNVISQNPAAGASAANGSAVAIVVSTGAASVSVPNVVGLTQAAATTAITNAGLTLGAVTQQASSTVAAGNVISQNPAAGASAANGSAVAIVVSTGAASVSVPNVVGLTQAAATTAITNAGLTLGAVTLQASTTVAAGNVISQNPAGGTSAAQGSSVALTVSTGTLALHVSGTTATGTGTATVDLTGGTATCGFSSFAFLPVSGAVGSPGTPPQGVTFPQGLFGFALGPVCATGGTVTITIHYPSPLPIGTQYWKFGPTPGNTTPHWYTIPATISGNTVMFTVTDGGLGDDDVTANGVIVDQGGPGVREVPQTTAAIPAVDRSMLALLAALLAVAGWWMARTRMR